MNIPNCTVKDATAATNFKLSSFNLYTQQRRGAIPHPLISTSTLIPMSDKMSQGHAPPSMVVDQLVEWKADKMILAITHGMMCSTCKEY